MWRNIRDPELLATYRRELPGPSQPIEVLLSALAVHPQLEGLFAKTSHGELSLTTAPNYSVMEKHASIAVARSRKGGFVVAFFEPDTREPTAERACGPSELLEVVELYLLRLVLESSQPSFG